MQIQEGLSARLMELIFADVMALGSELNFNGLSINLFWSELDSLREHNGFGSSSSLAQTYFGEMAKKF